MYHLNHAVNCNHAEVVHVLTGDTTSLTGGIMGWKKFGFII